MALHPPHVLARAVRRVALDDHDLEIEPFDFICQQTSDDFAKRAFFVVDRHDDRQSPAAPIDGRPRRAARDGIDAAGHHVELLLPHDVRQHGGCHSSER
jgi:hypothetical protein